MSETIKLRKGLDIRLKGRAAETVTRLKPSAEYSLVPDDFVGVTPKVAVKEGDHVRAGDALFVNKRFPEVGFASPVSGTVTAVVRGDRRKVLRVTVKADAQQEYADFGVKDPRSSMELPLSRPCSRLVSSATSTSFPMPSPPLPTRCRRPSLSPPSATSRCRATSSWS